ncbi:molybdate ABC transporter substrate-binding protein [Roseibium sp. MMSF_3412]|uniref:molybdate ABC transporter substrate-binding protein n=1 Tax=Roseibium sp. MMSF_3412 TaxID=3046712 RepID=UPI00273D1221|nr:molybdate ABC transporter substrate-binding protein [Roseibium sp. MMSF_3412]
MYKRFCLAIAFMAALLPPIAAASELTVFAAASMREAMERIASEFESETGMRVVFSFAGTGTLARQVEAGAPADLFISADSDWMDYVAENGGVEPASVRQIASNKLVLAGPKESPALGLNAAEIAGFLDGQRLAMADPDTVPAGRYGKAALENLGLWQSVSGQLAPMENVRVALASVARGDTPLGLVYRTDAQIEPNVAILATFPDTSHPEIRYLAAVTEVSSNPAADPFLEFLTGPDAQEILQSLGFVTDKVE